MANTGMASSEIVDYIHLTWGKGFPKEMIRAKLLQAGHSEKSIDAAFQQVFPDDHKGKISGLEAKAMSAALVIAFILLAVGISGMMGSMFGEDTSKLSGNVVYSPQMCKSFPKIDVQDWCYYKVARRLNDAGYCSYISSSEVMDFCNSIISGKVDCSKITDKSLEADCRS